MTPTPTATASPSLPLPLPYISLSYTLVHRCRPRAVVDLLSSSSSSSSSSSFSDHLLCPFPPKMFPFPVCSRGFHACNENTRGKARIHRKIRILRKHSTEDESYSFGRIFDSKIGNVQSIVHVPSRINNLFRNRMMEKNRGTEIEFPRWRNDEKLRFVVSVVSFIDFSNIIRGCF